MMNHQAVEIYVDLMRRFVDGQIDALAFERAYLDMFKTEKETLTEDEFQVLDTLFSDVDAFCDDPALLGTDDLDAQQLRAKCSEALAANAKLNQTRYVSHP
jgi:hypothetical protein